MVGRVLPSSKARRKPLIASSSWPLSRAISAWSNGAPHHCGRSRAMSSASLRAVSSSVLFFRVEAGFVLPAPCLGPPGGLFADQVSRLGETPVGSLQRFFRDNLSSFAGARILRVLDVRICSIRCLASSPFSISSERSNKASRTWRLAGCSWASSFQYCRASSGWPSRNSAWASCSRKNVRRRPREPAAGSPRSWPPQPWPDRLPCHASMPGERV